MTDSEPPHVEPKKGQRNLHPYPEDIPFSDQRGRRRACATFDISHNHNVDGKIYELTMESLRRVYTDCYKHWKCNIELENLYAVLMPGGWGRTLQPCRGIGIAGDNATERTQLQVVSIHLRQDPCDIHEKHCRCEDT